MVICGFNPASLWGLRQRRAHWYQRWGVGDLFLPEAGEFIAYRRLRDWLRLLGFEVEVSQFGCWRPAISSDKWLQRSAWMDTLGAAGGQSFGAVYFIVAVKRVRGTKMIGTVWKPAKGVSTAPIPLTNRSHRSHPSK